MYQCSKKSGFTLPEKITEKAGKGLGLPVILFILPVFFITLNHVQAQRYDQYVGFERRAQQLMRFTMDTLYIPPEGIFRNGQNSSEQTYSSLLPLAAVLQGGLEMEGILRGPSYTSKTVAVINKYYNTQLTPAAFQQYPVKAGMAPRFFADNGYIAFSYTQKFARTGDELFRSRSQKIYQYLMTGLRKGKGISFKEDDSVAISTNATAATILTAIGLHNATREPAYLIEAQELYRTAKINLRATDGLYLSVDNQEGRQTGIPSQAAANGAMLHNAVLFYGITRDTNYLFDARQLAEATFSRFNPLISERQTDAWGNSLLLRGYFALYKYHPEKKYLQAYYQYLLQERKENYRLYDLQTLGAIIEMNAILTQILRRESF